MINNERIVPITSIDLISMYGFALVVAAAAASGTAPTALAATTTDGQFTVGEAGTYIASEPVQTLNFTAEGTVYFVAAYDYSGISVSGTAVTPDGNTVLADARTLYKAKMSGGSVTITKVGF